MPQMRFNHMELTFPRGTLTTELREEIDAFYGSVFGWTGVDAEVVGQMCHILLSEEAQQFILLAESDKPMQSPGYDHLGLLFATREEVDEKLEQVKRYQEKDDRVRIKEYDDLVIGDITTRAFYVKYLLPIFFDVQALERGGEPIGNALTKLSPSGRSGLSGTAPATPWVAGRRAWRRRRRGGGSRWRARPR